MLCSSQQWKERPKPCLSVAGLENKFTYRSYWNRKNKMVRWAVSLMKWNFSFQSIDCSCLTLKLKYRNFRTFQVAATHSPHNIFIMHNSAKPRQHFWHFWNQICVGGFLQSDFGFVTITTLLMLEEACFNLCQLWRYDWRTLPVYFWLLTISTI